MKLRIVISGSYLVRDLHTLYLQVSKEAIATNLIHTQYRYTLLDQATVGFYDTNKSVTIFFSKGADSTNCLRYIKTILNISCFKDNLFLCLIYIMEGTMTCERSF